MKTIAFTQFLRPHGTPAEVTIERPEEIAQKAEKIRAHGYSFEIEELTSGHINMDICNDEGQLANELCENGPDVPVRVDKMINTAYEKLFKGASPV